MTVVQRKLRPIGVPVGKPKELDAFVNRELLPVVREMRDVLNAMGAVTTEFSLNRSPVAPISGMAASGVYYDCDGAWQPPRWDDIKAPSTGINPPGAASDPGRSNVTGRFQFDSVTQEIIAIEVQNPHQWRAGSPGSAHVHWARTTSASGGVYWQVEYKATDIGAVESGSYTTIGGGTVAPDITDLNTAGQHLLTPLSPDMDLSGLGASGMILVRLSRLPTDPGDTYGADADLREFDIHILIDAHGTVDVAGNSYRWGKAPSSYTFDVTEYPATFASRSRKVYLEFYASHDNSDGYGTATGISVRLVDTDGNVYAEQTGITATDPTRYLSSALTLPEEEVELKLQVARTGGSATLDFGVVHEARLLVKYE